MSSQQYQVSWLMYMGCLYIYLNLLYFQQFLWLLVYRPYTSFVKFISNYFRIWCYIKWNCFLNFIFVLFIVSLWKYNWFLHTDLVFCNFAEFISSNSFVCVWILHRFLNIRSCHLQIRIVLLFLSQFEDLFSCLIALARMSSTMLNRTCESGHPFLLPHLRKKAFSLSSLSMMIAHLWLWLP